MNLKVITQHYISNIRPHKEPELNWFRQQPTLGAAIEYAALAIDHKGKRYNHQRRLKKVNLERSRELLSANEKLLRQCKNFDELKTLIHGLLESVDGVGELYIYDTAFRLGAKLNLLPMKVYLHAGTRDGAEILGFDRKFEALEVDQLPAELRELKPYEIEDVLCIYKLILVNANDNDFMGIDWCGSDDNSPCT